MIFGLDPQNPLPDKWVPLEAVAVIKCLDEDGEPTLYLSTTKNISTWEALGMVQGAKRALEDDLMAGFEPDEDGED